jgi:MFS family permease
MSKSNEGIAPNAKRLLFAGFMAILAAGIGFGIRGGILANWAADFGFTAAQLGDIGGAGFTGFCFGIIIGGVVVDKIGYGKLVVAAFLFHAPHLNTCSSRAAKSWKCRTWYRKKPVVRQEVFAGYY